MCADVGSRNGWDWVVDLAKALWAARVAVLSVVAGAFILIQPAAQDAIAALSEAMKPGKGNALDFHYVVLVPVAFAVVTLLLWSMPVYLTTRWLLEKRCPGWSHPLAITLGLATLAAILVACYLTFGDLPELDADNAAFLDRTRAGLWGVVGAILVAAGAFTLFAIWRLGKAPGNRMFRAFFYVSFIGFALVIIGLMISPITVYAPLSQIARLLGYDPYLLDMPDFSRAITIPLILGAWVPLLGWLSDAGYRHRAPYLTLLFITLGGISLIGGRNTVRSATTSSPTPPTTAAERPTLDMALAEWKVANGCSEDSTRCPRPIIVAAAGGASRAAFFTASVIGHFLDVERHPLDPRSAGSDQTRADDGRYVIAETAGSAREVANRIFAFSGVSGGSVGAVLITAAMRNAGENFSHPCARDTKLSSMWYGEEIKDNWRNCLEVLTSGDYLTPTIFGLAFSDWFPFSSQDRAAVLEQLWEKNFFEAIGKPTRNLGTPFLDYHPKCPEAGCKDVPWLPLLFLNGTSVTTGQRIITSSLQPEYTLPTGVPCPAGIEVREAIGWSNCPVFRHAIDFHALLANKNEPSDGFETISAFLHPRQGGLLYPNPGSNITDIPVSTAASNSARFPLVSPPGIIRNLNGVVVDRIVDGGYFENYGALGALEISKAIYNIDNQIKPFVLLISNDPGSTALDYRDTTKSAVPYVTAWALLPELGGPLNTVIQGRSSRGRLAVAELEAWLDATLPPPRGRNFAHIRVWPEAQLKTAPHLTYCDLSAPSRDVAMSWWLAKTTQLHLRQQLEHGKKIACGPGNDEAVKTVWLALKKAPVHPAASLESAYSPAPAQQKVAP